MRKSQIINFVIIVSVLFSLVVENSRSLTITNRDLDTSTQLTVTSNQRDKWLQPVEGEDELH